MASKRLGIVGIMAMVGLAATAVHAADDDAIEFNRDIRPILSDKCFACHGPDSATREADLRLDIRDSAVAADDQGHAAITPGNPDASSLVQRIFAKDADDLMPPPDSHKTLTEREKDLLKAWIAAGAEYQPHWAFITPVKPPLPAVKDQGWPRGEIDRFVLARLEKLGLKPAPEADRRTLIRRVTLDLTGLPPTTAEVEAFVNDTDPQAYEMVVERLLNSSRFGEHRARYWLDAARYGDTHGLHLDNYREMWPYRDWVVRAFNDNLPYDQFVLEQLAGDMLPNATLDQKIASGFNRAHVTTNEGGSIAEEVYVRNVIDRVSTTGTVFMGLTLGCAVCHDHKFDPITAKEFYSLFAIFNSCDDNPMDGNKKEHPPIVRVPSPEQSRQLAEAQAQLKTVRETIATQLAAIEYFDDATAQPPAPEPVEFVWFDDGTPAGANLNGEWNWVTDKAHSGERSLKRNQRGQGQVFFTDAKEPLVVKPNDILFAWVWIDPEDGAGELMLQFNDGSWDHRAYWGKGRIEFGKDGTTARKKHGNVPARGKWTRLEVKASDVGLGDKPIHGWAFTQYSGTVYWDRAGVIRRPDQAFTSFAAWLEAQEKLEKPDVPDALKPALNAKGDKRTNEQTAALRDHFLRHVHAELSKDFKEVNEQEAALAQKIVEIESAMPTTLVSEERKEPKPAYVLTRGEYTQKAEQVERGVPAALPEWDKDLPRNRLGFAKWLIDPEHPLTARVTVNRFWQQVFGTGLVKTAEDFGAQGDQPSHPQLLDFLAVQFMEDGWDIKRYFRRLVTSATYRQAANVTPQLAQRDPENRLLARGPRHRLDAEVLRDQALFVSGLMVEKLGGPGVKPPQPPGLWEAVGYTGSNTVKFVADTGHEKVHRRTLYTFLKRTAPPPQMTVFDGPSREACVVRRERTNTPLQALLMMNDPQYVECARGLAERAMHEAGPKPADRLRFMFENATARPPQPVELKAMLANYQEHLSHYMANVEAAKKLIAVGETQTLPDPALDPSELAAWTMMGNLILNLDEVINKG